MALIYEILSTPQNVVHTLTTYLIKLFTTTNLFLHPSLEFETNLDLSISNMLSSTILFKWELSDPRIKASVSKSSRMQPGNGKMTFTFKSQTPFTQETLNSLLKLYAVSDKDKQPVELNSKSFLVITPLAPNKLTRSMSIRISAKGNNLAICHHCKFGLERLKLAIFHKVAT